MISLRTVGRRSIGDEDLHAVEVFRQHDLTAKPGVVCGFLLPVLFQQFVLLLGCWLLVMNGIDPRGRDFYVAKMTARACHKKRWLQEEISRRDPSQTLREG